MLIGGKEMQQVAIVVAGGEVIALLSDIGISVKEGMSVLVDPVLPKLKPKPKIVRIHPELGEERL